MSTTLETYTVIRPGKFGSVQQVKAFSGRDARQQIQQLLSSPISSYELEFEETVTQKNITVRHPQNYAERLKSTKSRLEALEAVEAKREAAEAKREDIFRERETRTRLAQALHDKYIKVVPVDLQDRLRAAGRRFLPPLLSACAIYYNEPLDVLNFVENDVLDSYSQQMVCLQQNGLSYDDMDTLWGAIPLDGIRLMVHVWLMRSAD